MTVVVVDAFGERSQTFVANELTALRRIGHPVRVEALAAPRDPVPEPVGPRVRVDRMDRETTSHRLRDLAWLAARRPAAVARDVLARGAWAQEEPVAPLRHLAPLVRRLHEEGDRHLHAHFALGAALTAWRLSRLSGGRATWSFTAHAHDVFATPANLRAKLEAASFATTGAEYVADRLRALAPSATVQVQVMGVDLDTFTTSPPRSSARTVLAVGRLVPKKGFADLARAAALLGDRARVVVAGEGPQREELERLGGLELMGAVNHERVAVLLEQADVLAMPCVVAPDGDRDSMPVVVKEAMARGRPVVVSDAVGLPELVDQTCGRVVPAGEPQALAAALREVLDLPAAARARLGRAGRERVEAMADLGRETAKLAGWIDAAGAQVAATTRPPDPPRR